MFEKLREVLTKRDQLVADNETFIRMIQIAWEDSGIRDNLEYILSQNKAKRKSICNVIIGKMLKNNEPEDNIVAFSVFLDDDLAERALEIIKEGEK
jgi:hypothetical protein